MITIVTKSTKKKEKKNIKDKVKGNDNDKRCRFFHINSISFMIYKNISISHPDNLLA